MGYDPSEPRDKNGEWTKESSMARTVKIAANLPLSFDEWAIEHFGQDQLQRSKTNSNLRGLMEDQYKSYQKRFTEDNQKMLKYKIDQSQSPKKYENIPSSSQKEITKNYSHIKQYDALGLRALTSDQRYRVGDDVRPSRDWDFENDTSSDKYLAGTSMIGLDINHIFDTEDLLSEVNTSLGMMNYGDGPIVLIGGDASISGDDPSESIIINGKVLMFLRK
jgi:hypothetical protein